MSQSEPLIWLVARLFTDEFADKESLLRAKLNPFTNGLTSDDLANLYLPAPYANAAAIMAASEKFIASNIEAKNCYDKALAAVDNRTLHLLAHKIDKWGDKTTFYRENEIDTCDFLIWAQSNGYLISESVRQSASVAIRLAATRKAHLQEQEAKFPPITEEQYAMVLKEPLWILRDGIHYIIGRRQRGNDLNFYYKDGDGLFEKILKFANDAYDAEHLKLIGYDDGRILASKVEPGHFIEWAKTLPLDISIIRPQTATLNPHPNHVTPDMALMFDAIEHFWKDYDLTKPNPNIAPMKKNVVAWLVKEAANRGITDFSKTRAEVIDTIIRCPEARKGGNTY